MIRDLPFNIGNAIKYVYRCEQKDGVVQDLSKAEWYLNDFAAHPLSTISVDTDVVAAVLEGVSEFERAMVLALLYVYTDYSAGVADEPASLAAARYMIEQRILEESYNRNR